MVILARLTDRVTDWSDRVTDAGVVHNNIFRVQSEVSRAVANITIKHEDQINIL